jgi:hypothetical protein
VTSSKPPGPALVVIENSDQKTPDSCVLIWIIQAEHMEIVRKVMEFIKG